jgi:hypothetical protein
MTDVFQHSLHSPQQIPYFYKITIIVLWYVNFEVEADYQKVKEIYT